MKANEAPEKIWVHELSAKELNVPMKEYHVEYTRTDAFIEKACKWLKENADHYVGHYLNDDDTYMDESFIEDFEKYMKEE